MISDSTANEIIPVDDRDAAMRNTELSNPKTISLLCALTKSLLSNARKNALHNVI
jgi:hypothetical protein